MKKNIGISLLLCLLATTPGISQRYVELARFYYSSTALNNFEQSDTSTRVNELGMDITLPILINESDAILTGLIYERIETKLFETGPAENFSVVGLRVGLSKKHSEKWSGTYLLLPKLASDFKDITWKDFQLGGIALLKYTKRENLNYKLGVYFNTELSGPFRGAATGSLLPLQREKVEVNLMLPFLADINVRLVDRLYVGLNFTGLVRSYHLSEIA